VSRRGQRPDLLFIMSNIFMQVGKQVRYITSFAGGSLPRKVTGVIMEVKGTKWVKVAWSDKIICSEHVDDLQVVNEYIRS